MPIESALVLEVAVTTVAVGHRFEVRYSDRAKELGIWTVEFSPNLLINKMKD